MPWPDVVIIVILMLGTISGFRRGFIGELSGAVALAAGVVAGFAYGGWFDGAVIGLTHLGPGSAHVIGIFVTGLLAYGIVLFIGFVLETVAKLPLLGIANSLGGAAIGFVKAVLLVWVAVYVALFFPLSRDLRADLHRSALVGFIATPDRSLDEHVRASLPWYLKALSIPLFDRHHV